MNGGSETGCPVGSRAAGFGVALSDDLALVGDDEGARVLALLGHGLIERGIDFGHEVIRTDVSRGPVLCRRVGESGRDELVLEEYVVGALGQDRAALIASVLRRLLRTSRCPDPCESLLLVDFILERIGKRLRRYADVEACSFLSDDRALETLKGEREMNAKELFGGFDSAEHEAEVQRRWGDTDPYREAARRTRRYSMLFDVTLAGGGDGLDVAIDDRRRHQCPASAYACTRFLIESLSTTEGSP